MKSTATNGDDDISSDHDERLLRAKRMASEFHQSLISCRPGEVKEEALDRYTDSSAYIFRSVYPFRDYLHDPTAVAQTFWKPLKQAWTGLHRRTDLFFGGRNALTTTLVANGGSNCTSSGEDTSLWVVSMGHFVGLLDEDWMGLRATRQMTTLRFVQFDQVQEDAHGAMKIVQTGLFLDLIGLLESMGYHALPPSTGRYFCYPGPADGRGLEYQHTNAPVAEGQATQALVDRMVDDLTSINHLNTDTTCPPHLLRRTWHEDMIWYGPGGIGATCTILRYQEQHQWPFRSQLDRKRFLGHAVRVAEGPYAAFFGWPSNLTNTPRGGFLGLPGLPASTADTTQPDCPMQVVDVYRRQGDKLKENWVFIDIPWYLKAQGVDVLARTTGILNPQGTIKGPSGSAPASMLHFPSNFHQKIANSLVADEVLPTDTASSSSESDVSSSSA